MTDPRFLYIIPIARASHAKFRPRGPFASITLAQWAVESGYGLHMSGVNNPFGIKATRQDIIDGQARLVLTHEWNGTRYVAIEQYFASYDDLEDAFDHHAQLLTTIHYQRCMDAKTPADYAQALHLCGYATAPNYATALMSMITANSLTQYDEA